MKRLLVFFSLLALAALMWGCTYKTSTAVPRPTTELIIIDNSATQAAPIPVKLLSYENPRHGFSFTYADTWALTEKPGDGSATNTLIRLSREDVQLTIEYGFLAEIRGLEKFTPPAGEWTELESVSFFDRDLPMGEYVDDGSVSLAAFPGLSDVFMVNDLFFRIILLPSGSLTAEKPALAVDLLEEVTGIVESFSPIQRSSAAADPYADWQTFLSMDYGLLVRYPSQWVLEETDLETVPGMFEKALTLTKGKSQLTLGYHFKGSYVPHSEGFVGGLLVDEGLVPFLGQEIPKLVLQYENRDKAVFYYSLEGMESGNLVFSIRLQDTTAGAGYDLIEVDDADQTEAESILAAVHQFAPVLAAPPESLVSRGTQYFLTFDACFDLDAGMQKEAGNPACDFGMERVAGSNDKVKLQPLNQAVFDFETTFTDLPTAADCASAENLNTVKKTELLLDERHICYQANTGRYGSLILRGMTSDGVSLDWQTGSKTGLIQRSTMPGSGEYDIAVTVRDMTIKDGTVMKPGETFTKTWQLLNKGTSTWTTGYAIRFESGDRLGAPYEVAMPSEVPPGGAVNISVEMTAPADPGEYTGYWVMRNAAGHRFGMGTDGTQTFWVMIVVEK